MRIFLLAITLLLLANFKVSALEIVDETYNDNTEESTVVETTEQTAPKRLTTEEILANADVEAVDELLQKGFDVNVRNNDGWTPLVFVLLNNQDIEVAARLIEAGADVNAPSLNGITPLQAAVSVANALDEHWQLLKAERGAETSEVQEADFERFAAEQMARAMQIVALLVNVGADVNQETPRGTPLMIAATNARNGEMIDLLLTAGANVNLQDRKGRTALFYAHAFNNEDIEAQLIKAGAKIDILDKNRYTYMEAVKQNFVEEE